MTTTYYAIGDVHGMAYQLDTLLFKIIGSLNTNERNVLVFLGDYVDRGPDSKGVVERIMGMQERPHPFAEVIALKGNHEDMMFDAAFLQDRQSVSLWTMNGGRETLQSYATEFAFNIPKEHIEWMSNLPTKFVDTEEKIIFCHAGFYPAGWPNATDECLMWTRNSQFMNSDRDDLAVQTGWDNPELEGYLVVHGHTPQNYNDGKEPYHDSRRINLDTGACFGGMLSCGVIRPGHQKSFLQVSGGLIRP